MSGTGRSTLLHLTTDKMLGLAGGGLAAASFGFGVCMNIHGPVAGFGTSKDFTVFAQLAPRHQPRQPHHAAPQPAVPADAADDQLDMAATGSIAQPRVSATGEGKRRDAETARIPSVTLEAASSDAATIAIDGRPTMVRVGDMVPGAGEVLEIRPGRHAVVRTSHGLIMSSQRD